jgi:TolB-like protein
MSFFNELKRRNVFKVGIAYAIVAWFLLQVSDTLVPALHLPEWFNSGVAFVLIIGFPIAIILAWAFDLTPDGIKKTKTKKTEQTDAEDSEVPETTSVEVDDKSIAVLPFVDMSPNQDQGWFSDGISEQILNELVGLEGLKVTARTSSFYYKGRNESIQKIAQELGVATVLEGSLHQSNDRIRITAQLIKADDGYHLWSETYDRGMDDVFAIQTDIAQAIAAGLRNVTQHVYQCLHVCQDAAYIRAL